MARGRKKEGDFLKHIHWHLGTLPQQYQTDFYGTLEMMATSKNVYGKCPFTISTLNFLISYCHFLFFQRIPSSPWTPVAVLPHLQSTDPITFALIITSHHAFTHAFMCTSSVPPPLSVSLTLLPINYDKRQVDCVASQSCSISLNSFPLA